MSIFYLLAFCFLEAAWSAKLQQADGAPVYRDECKDPSMNDCPSTAFCIDQFYGYSCQCKSGLVDRSTDPHENPGRICVPPSELPPETVPPPVPAQETQSPFVQTEPSTRRPRPTPPTPEIPEPTQPAEISKEDITKSPLDQIARDAEAAAGHKKKGQSQQKGSAQPSQRRPPNENQPSQSASTNEKPKSANDGPSKAALRDTFNLFDGNKDGRINLTELKTATRNNKLNLSDADVRLMLRTADKNADGGVSFDEFHNLMKSRRSSSS